MLTTLGFRRGLFGSAFSGIVGGGGGPTGPIDLSVTLLDSIFDVPTIINPYENGAATRNKPGRSLLAAPTLTFYQATDAPASCDVLLNLTSMVGGRSANLEVRSGRNVRVCGGDISLAAGEIGTFQMTTGFPVGSMFIQGLYYDLKLGLPCDAMGFTGNATANKRMPLFIYDCHIRGVNGYNAGTHGDGMQVRSTGYMSNLVMLNTTIYTKYQGIIERAFGNGTGYIASYKKNVDIHYDDTFTPSYVEDASTVMWFAGDTGNISGSGALGRCNSFNHQDSFRIFKRASDPVTQAMRPNQLQNPDGVNPVLTQTVVGAFTQVTCAHPTSKWYGYVMVANQGSGASAPGNNFASGDKGNGHPGPNWGVGFADVYGDQAISRPPGYNAVMNSPQLGANPLGFTTTAPLVAGAALGSAVGFLFVQDAPPNLIIDTPNTLGQRLKWRGGELVVNDWFDAGTYVLTFDQKDRQSGFSVSKTLTFNSTGSATWNITKPAAKYMSLDVTAVPIVGGNVASTYGSTYSLIGKGLTGTLPTLSAGTGPSGQSVVTFSRANQQHYECSHGQADFVTEFEFNTVLCFNSQLVSASSTTFHSLFGNNIGGDHVSLGKVTGTAGDFTHIMFRINGSATMNIPLLAPLVNGTYYALRCAMDEDGLFQFWIDGVLQGSKVFGSQQTLAVKRLFASSATATADVSVVYAQFLTAKTYNVMASKLAAYTLTRK